MLSTNLLLLVSVGYVIFLFLVAWWGDRRAAAGRGAVLRSPFIYTLSISVYCTSWTFYGAVGSAARNGLEFVTIYLGPTLVFIGWFWLLRKLVRIGRVHRVTSIADLISSRYGKSPLLAVIVTVIAVIGTTPYIALQLQSVTLSYAAISGDESSVRTAFWVAAGMALFTILFGTRTIDANERHHGVVAAIAVEALVKLVALIAVGAFAVWGLAGGVGEIFDRMPEGLIDPERIFGPRWVALTFLSATAIICLPRQFQVIVVENVDERHLSTAGWMFPLYLFLISLFVLPIAIAGLAWLPAGSNPDLFVLNLPLMSNRDELALLAFIGGFSSATSMVIVAAIALSTMISNHIVAPLALKYLMTGSAASGDVRELLIISRRIAIAVILGLGFLYFQATGGSDALAAIGLIAFVAMAQFLPAMIGGIYWRGATRRGAAAGAIVGTLLWAYTLFLPSFGGEALLSESVIRDGPFGIAVLRPRALFGLAGTDPLVHALIWSLGANALVFVVVSLFSHPGSLERLQGALFVDVFRSQRQPASNITQRAVASEDLFVLAQRILGADRARQLFDRLAAEQGHKGGLPIPTNTMIARLERELGGSIGAASAHAMINSVAGDETVTLGELLKIADEAQRLMETSQRLEQKTVELERTAAELRKLNERLRQLDRQKDEFLSQVSHELRTPMTSVRSFSEILLDEGSLSPEERGRFARIIHDESLRLTRLLDEILDISRLESGAAKIEVSAIPLNESVEAAVAAISALAMEKNVRIRPRDGLPAITVMANPDRLRQVLINLLSNAIKYNEHPEPEIRFAWSETRRMFHLDVIDNGGGVSREEAREIFSKFIRGTRAREGQGAGLGLPISKAIMRRMQGDLTAEFDPDGAGFFRVSLLRAPARVSRRAAE